MGEKIKKFLFRSLVLYSFLITLLCLIYSPYITLTSDKDSHLILIDFPFYTKSLLIAK